MGRIGAHSPISENAQELAAANVAVAQQAMAFALSSDFSLAFPPPLHNDALAKGIPWGIVL